MIEEIAIKFGTELKPTQNSCKLQLYTSNTATPSPPGGIEKLS